MADSIENWKIILATSIPIKGTQWTISGYSWAARQTMVVIRELGIALDIGKDSEQSFTHIFITHAHYDHIKGLYTHLIGIEVAKIIFQFSIESAIVCII